MVSYNAIADITLGWKHTMVQLCLPKQKGVTLSLDRESQSLGMLEQFRLMITAMSRLKFLHVGDFWGEMDNDLDNNHVAVLKNLFPNSKSTSAHTIPIVQWSRIHTLYSTTLAVPEGRAEVKNQFNQHHNQYNSNQ